MPHRSRHHGSLRTSSRSLDQPVGARRADAVRGWQAENSSLMCKVEEYRQQARHLENMQTVGGRR